MRAASTLQAASSYENPLKVPTESPHDPPLSALWITRAILTSRRVRASELCSGVSSEAPLTIGFDSSGKSCLLPCGSHGPCTERVTRIPIRDQGSRPDLGWLLCLARARETLSHLREELCPLTVQRRGPTHVTAPASLPDLALDLCFPRRCACM